MQSNTDSRDALKDAVEKEAVQTVRDVMLFVLSRDVGWLCGVMTDSCVVA